MTRPQSDRWPCVCGARNHPTISRCLRCGELRPEDPFALPVAVLRPAPPAPPQPDPGPAIPARRSPQWVQWLFPLLLASCALVAALICYLFAAAQSAPTPSAALQPAEYRPAAPAPRGSQVVGSPSSQPTYASAVVPAASWQPSAPLTPLHPPAAGPRALPSVIPFSGARTPVTAPAHHLYSPERAEWLPSLYVPPPTYAARETPSAAGVIAKVAESVVLVSAQGPQGYRYASGFVVGPQQIATCAHVLMGATRLSVVGPEGKEVRVADLRADPENDVAILISTSPLPPPVVLADPDRSAEGEDAAVVGYPFSGEGGDTAVHNSPSGLAYVRGRLGGRQVRLSPAGNAVDVLRVEAGVSNGYSGGPVFSVRDGVVHGLLSFRVAADQVAGYAVPTRYLRRLSLGEIRPSSTLSEPAPALEIAP